MTDYTLSSGMFCRPFRSPWGAFPTRTMGISSGVSSAAIYPGSILTLDYADAVAQTSNAEQVKASTGTAGAPMFYIAGVSANGVSGSTATQGNEVQFWEANPLVEFKAVTKGGTIQSSNIGITKKLSWDSTLNIVYVDLSASTAADHRVVITQNIPSVTGISPVGDSGGFVAFRFLTALAGNIQGTSGLYNSTTPLLAFYR